MHTLCSDCKGSKKGGGSIKFIQSNPFVNLLIKSVHTFKKEAALCLKICVNMYSLGSKYSNGGISEPNCIKL